MAPCIANLALEAESESATVRSSQSVIVRPSVVAKVCNDAETRIWSGGWQPAKVISGVSIYFQVPQENVVSVITHIGNREYILGKELVLDLKAPFQILGIVERRGNREVAGWSECNRRERSLQLRQ